MKGHTMSDTHCPHGFYKHEDQCLDTQCLLDEVRELTKELRAANAALKAGRSGREEELQRELDEARDEVSDYARKLLVRDAELDAMAERAERAEAERDKLQQTIDSWGLRGQKAMREAIETLEAEADADIVAGRIKPAKPPKGANDE